MIAFCQLSHLSLFLFRCGVASGQTFTNCCLVTPRRKCRTNTWWQSQPPRSQLCYRCMREYIHCACARAGVSQGFCGATVSDRAPLPVANGSRHKQSALRGKKRATPGASEPGHRYSPCWRRAEFTLFFPALPFFHVMFTLE